MSETTPIIDVTPVTHSSSRIFPSAHARSDHSGYAQSARSPFTGTQDSFSRNNTASRNSVYGETASHWTPSSVAGGLAQMVVGSGLVLLGIPLLILPGPGLLSIAAGALLIARGASKIRPR